jgi:predicted enzyme related to lactoylglutathione lyase
MSAGTLGQFIWNELNTHDRAGAGRFFSTTLGWSLVAMPIPDGTYWLIKHGETTVGGLFDMSGLPHCQGVPEHWLGGYVAVADVAASVRQVLAAGAREIRAPFEVPQAGRIAMLVQPGGAVLGLITPKPR